MAMFKTQIKFSHFFEEKCTQKERTHAIGSETKDGKSQEIVESDKMVNERKQMNDIDTETTDNRQEKNDVRATSKSAIEHKGQYGKKRQGQGARSGDDKKT